MTLQRGTRLGSYEILAAIGAGGMGEVYRARDRKLERDIAIKVLPETLAADPERIARFEREARSLAALNHPNIAQIHGFEDSNGLHLLVMELVEGTTLGERIANGAIPVTDTLSIALQIVDALEAAHDRGIVHRDLKPANIKITSAGTVKVLDFGLAKAPSEARVNPDLSQSPTLTFGGTLGGVILGTAAYMSPEQARGLPVDKRADIWAFGCVLFEMLTGRQAFAGETFSDVMVSVLEHTPDWSALPPALPTAATRLLQRCLEKNSRRRLRDIGDARLDLDDSLVGAASARMRREEIRSTSRRASWWLGAAVAILALGTGTVGWFVRDRGVPVENPLADAHFMRFTDFEGTEREGAISPDGKFVAFVSDRNGPFDVWLSQVGSGRFVNLTQGNEPNLDSTLRVMGFASDGSELWLHDGDFLTPLRLLPLLGGSSRIFLAKSPAKTPPMNVAWSPDTTRLVYHTSDPGDPMFVADRTGENARQIFIDPNPGIHNHWPAWSPDGRWIYFSRGNPPAGEFDLWRISPSGGAPERLTHHNTLVAYPTPIAPRTVLYVARDQDGSGPSLWVLDPERKVTRRVSFGLEQYTSLTTSADGHRLVATVANPTASLWSLPILDRLVEERDVGRFVVATVRALAPRFGGSALFYLSSHGTGDGLWRYDSGQTIEIWKGADGPVIETPAISPDGLQIAFALRKNGSLRLHVMSAHGADLQALGNTLDVLGAACWSPDGKWLVTGGSGEHGPGLFKIPVDGGPVVQLANGHAVNPVWSPDGTLIVFTGANVGGQAPLLAVRPNGAPVQFPAINVRRFGERARFLPNGKGLVYMQGLAASQDFWLLDLLSNESRPLTRLNNLSAMRTFDISPDGKMIVFDRVRENSDIVLIDLTK